MLFAKLAVSEDQLAFNLLCLDQWAPIMSMILRRASVVIREVAVDLEPYHARYCRVLVESLAVEFLKSALADLPSHVACHVGL